MTTSLIRVSAARRQPHDTRTARRAVFALALCASLLITAFSSYVHAGVSSNGPVEGSHAWGRDGWCYVLRSGQWVRDSYFRSFPFQNTPTVYDLYYNRQYVKRVDVSQPGWTKELTAANAAPSSAVSWYMYQNNTNLTEANVYYFVKAFNRWLTLPQVKATIAQLNRQSAPSVGNGVDNQAVVLGGYGGYTGAGSENSASVLGGVSSGTGNPNPLTVDSIAADRARQQMSPQLRQQLLELDAYLNRSNDNSIKVNVLGTHVYRRP